MAWEDVVQTIPGLIANADLSTYQYRFVRKTVGVDLEVAIAGDGDMPIGVLGNRPSASGQAAEVITLGVTKVVAGEALVAGDRVSPMANGLAKKTELTITGADVGDFVVGQVLVGAATNEYAVITINGLNPWRVESA